MRKFLAALFLLGGVLAPAARAASPSVPAAPLVIYSASAATTAQAPLWGAIADGWGRDLALNVRFWKDLNDLRGVIMAGKGDIWIGHLDGFTQAARRGAPVTLIAVTAWAEKFQFLTLDAEATSPAALAERMAALEETLAVVPQGSPALAILDEARAEGGPAFRIHPMPPQQAGLELAHGGIRHLLVPDPLATALIAKFPALRRMGGLADLNPAWAGHLPMAGVAVRSSLIAERPELIAALTSGMIAWTERCQNDPRAAIAVLPQATRDEIGEAALIASFRFDPLRTRDAVTARNDTLQALAILDGTHPTAPGFLPPETR